MQLERISIRDFMCFDAVDLVLPSKGLLFLYGHSDENAFSGANNIGKTTFFNAICWCLYEKTADGCKAGDLQQIGTTKGYSVELTLIEDRIQCSTCLKETKCSGCTVCLTCVPECSICSCLPITLKRTWKPNTLERDGKLITNEELEKWLGITYEQFLMANYFSQESSHIIDMTPSSRLQFLSELFELDEWHDYTQEAKETLASGEIKLAADRGAYSALNDAILLNKNEQNTLQLSLASFDGNVQVQKQNMQTQIQNLTGRIEQIKLGDIPALSVMLQECKKQVEDAYTKKEKLFNAERELDYQSRSLQTALANKRADLKRSASSIGQACFTCKQPLNTDHIRGICANLIKEIKQVEADYQVVEEQLSKARKDLHEIIRLISVTDRSAQLERDIAESRLQEQMKADLVRQVSELQLKIDTVVSNPFTDLLAEAIKRGDELTRRYELLATSIDEQQVHQDLVKLWVKLFPQVRLMVLNDILSELEIYFNQALESVGLANWVIELDTERELADNKKSKRELVINVTNALNQKLNVKTVSGSQKKQLRIAGTLGLADLLRNAFGSKLQFELWDEPCANMSIEKSRKVVESLKEVAEKKLVLFSDHKILDLDNFQELIYLVQDTKGISSATRQLPNRGINDAAEPAPLVTASV